MTIPPEVVALCTLLAGLAWLFFARSQRGRKQATPLAWVSLPFFALTGIYILVSIDNADIDLHALHARYGIVGISVSQAIILFVIFLISRGQRYGE